MIPARPYKPRDKAKVEAAVRLAKRWILAVLQHRLFSSAPAAAYEVALSTPAQ